MTDTDTITAIVLIACSLAMVGMAVIVHRLVTR